MNKTYAQARSKMPRPSKEKAVYALTQVQMNARDKRFWDAGVKSAAENAQLYMSQVAYPSAQAAIELTAALGWALGSAWGMGMDDSLKGAYTPNSVGVITEKITALTDKYQSAYTLAHGEGSPTLAEVIAKINELIEAFNTIADDNDSVDGWKRLITLALHREEWLGKLLP